MGWTTSQDPYRPIRMTFPDRDSAVDYALKNDWRYIVREDRPRRIGPNPWAGTSSHQLYRGVDTSKEGWVQMGQPTMSEHHLPKDTAHPKTRERRRNRRLSFSIQFWRLPSSPFQPLIRRRGLERQYPGEGAEVDAWNRRIPDCGCDPDFGRIHFRCHMLPFRCSFDRWVFACRHGFEISHGLELIDGEATLGAIGELGVILLLFMLGLEFSLGKLMELRRLIFGVGLLQVATTSGRV